ncbi:BLUF domain-containing protein [Aquimarina aggregata]|uniref:BLUF domain-containing protein n=1 Tax=Aquimarina aggregata TaxID=1642818 RepID=UPI00249161FD|nr:BLUF domain-containing protein [Aquimarina aggregata]
MRYTISYVSTINSSLSKSEVKMLMGFVKDRNSILGVTGILIHTEGNFFQVLEGEQELVKSLFKKIKIDDRHHSIIKMLDTTTDSTSFSQYHSSFTVVSERDGQNELRQFLKKEKENNPGHFKSISYLTKKIMNIL